MSENMFPRNNNYEELIRLNKVVTELLKDMEIQKKYIASIPDNVHQSVEESCKDMVLPGVNEFTHEEITSMYYHIQSSMCDEYKKQAKKIENIMSEKFSGNIVAEQKMLYDTLTDILKRDREKQEKSKKLLFLNTILSGMAVVFSFICIIIVLVAL